MSVQRFSGSDAIDVGRLLFTDRMYPFNSTQVASLSESGVSLATAVNK